MRGTPSTDHGIPCTTRPMMSEKVIVIENNGDLGDRLKALSPERVRTEEDAITAIRHVLALPPRKREALWIADQSRIGLLSSFFDSYRASKTMLGDVIVLGRIGASRCAVLASLFRRVLASDDESFRAVPLDVLSEILRSPDPSKLAIAAGVDKDLGALVLYLGNRERLTAPLSSFGRSGDGTEPDFDDLAIIDCGQTIRFGTYEAAVEAILYENDPAFRRLRAKERRESEKSFGASLRRLRLQRGLSRDAFPEISAKEIARLERGEVKRPHVSTLNAIAARLGVRPEDIETY